MENFIKILTTITIFVICLSVLILALGFNAHLQWHKRNAWLNDDYYCSATLIEYGTESCTQWVNKKSIKKSEPIERPVCVNGQVKWDGDSGYSCIDGFWMFDRSRNILKK